MDSFFENWFYYYMVNRNYYLEELFDSLSFQHQYQNEFSESSLFKSKFDFLLYFKSFKFFKKFKTMLYTSYLIYL